jgi:hypothetical protein
MSDLPPLSPVHQPISWRNPYAGGRPPSINYSALSIVAAMQQNFDEENTADWDRVFVDNIYKLCHELNSIYRWYQFGRRFDNGTEEVFMTVLAFGYKSKTVFYGRTEVMIINQEPPRETVKDWEVVQ